MKLKTKILILSILTLITCTHSFALTLDEYMGQVRLNNEGVRGAKLGEEAKNLRTSEYKLFYTPSFFISAEHSDDRRPTNAPSFQGSQTVRDWFRAGIAKNFSTGTKAQISYNIYKTEINGATPGVLARDSFFDVAPQFELSQSLWRNWLGAEFNANAEAQKSQIEAARLNDQFNLKQLLVKAENTYWRLFFAERTVQVQKDSLDRARKMRDWNAKRMRSNLVDEADYLQTEALLQTRELEQETAHIELDTAKREFNSVRQSTEEVSLLEGVMPDTDFLLTAQAPVKSGQREDVLIAIENQKLITANAVLGVERNKPNLEVYGSYSINGRDDKYGQAYDQAADGTKPWTVVGVRFSTPLDFGAMSDYKKGYAQDKVAADLNARRKAYEVDREWEILSNRFEEFKKRVKLSKRMEEVQLKKLTAEKKRFDQGRTTTFQVLQFEQDFFAAQLLKLRNEAELVTVYNQLQLFTGISNE